MFHGDVCVFFFPHGKRGGEHIQGLPHLLVVSRSKDASIARPHAAFAVCLYEACINTVVKVTFFNKRNPCQVYETAFVQCAYIKGSVS